MSGTTIALVVVVAVALVAALVIRSSAGRTREVAAAHTALGLEAVPALDSDLGNRILDLYKPPEPNPAAKVEWSLVDVHRAADARADCYSMIVRCHRTEWKQSHGGKAVSSRTIDERIVALVARDPFNAPRLDILPIALTADSKAGAFAQAIVDAGNALLDGASTKDAVDFYDRTEFDRRYLVRSPAADAARQFLDAPRRRTLAEMEGVHVRVDGSLIVVSSAVDRIKNRSLPAAEQLGAELALARRVLDALSQRS